ncbi:hypothetical protein V7111_26190, partial [Neobacillus niacini]
FKMNTCMFFMENNNGDSLATSEQMLMGINMKEGLPSPIPSLIQSQIESLGKLHQDLPKPNEVGRKIGIRKKKKILKIKTKI